MKHDFHNIFEILPCKGRENPAVMILLTVIS